MAKAKFIPDKFILQALNKVAIKHGYNQCIKPEAFDRIPEARYPITQSILCNGDSVVRCNLVLNVINNQPITVLLDIDLDKFDKLPEYDTETGEVTGDALTFLKDYIPRR